MGRSTRGNRRSYLLALGAVVGALGAIVLVRSQGHARPAPPPPPGPLVALARAEAAPLPPRLLDGPGAAGPRARLAGPGLEGAVALSHGAVVAGGASRVHAEVTLSATAPDSSLPRPPVALVVVLDVSGSMLGRKIEEARRATLALAARMRAEDHLAVVAYNGGATVPVPLGPLGDRRDWVRSALAALRAGGGTNIPGGLALATMALEGAPEGHVQRMVLVSDGLDGSRVPVTEVASRLRRAAARGVTLSALGVGVDYDERFLSSVADAGRGNYEFLADADALARFLGRELDEASSTAVAEVAAELELPEGARVVAVRGADAVPQRGASLSVPFGAMAGGDRRRAFIEVEMPAAPAGAAMDFGVRLSYRTVADGERHSLAGDALPIRVVADEALAARSRDVDVHAAALAAGADARQAEAIEAWRAGRAEEALRISAGNQAVLRQVQQARPSADVTARLAELERDDANFRSRSASSPSGQAYGLDANAGRRARLWQRSR